MKRGRDKQHILLVAVLMAVGSAFSAYAAVDSGSTGADGAFNPTADTELTLPPSGVFNFTTVNIPVGVTVTFKKNALNTPAVILATGDVTVAGTINVSGAPGAPTGTAGDGNLADDGVPGAGGPGGYDGGVGGNIGNVRGGNGLGPGGGGGGVSVGCGSGAHWWMGGGGGGFANVGGARTVICGGASIGSTGGSAYGTGDLLSLVGGSGGGGGLGGSFNYRGAGGGGGGGAILIASSGTLNVTGAILAIGGDGGAISGLDVGSGGGGGSGGAIRLAATAISGNGTISARRGTVGSTAGVISPSSTISISSGAEGSDGRVRLEAEFNFRTAGTTPGYSLAKPGPIFFINPPSLRITSVAGVVVPDPPSGGTDITLPASTENPITVTLATTNVPVGNTVSLTVTPDNLAPTTVVSPPLSGTDASATTSVQVSLPSGPSVLQASTSYTIVASLGDALGHRFAKGERVERVEVTAAMNGSSAVTLITASGKRYPMSGPLPGMPAS